MTMIQILLFCLIVIIIIDFLAFHFKSSIYFYLFLNMFFELILNSISKYTYFFNVIDSYKWI